MIWTAARSVVMWVFGDDIIKYVLYVVAGILVFIVLESAATAHAIFSQPWGQWWASGQFGISSPSTIPVAGTSISIDPSPQGMASNYERYQLALGAGFTGTDAIEAVAVSDAENIKGDPTLQHRNDDGTIDTGLWQVNERNAAEFGGMEALKDMQINANAAYTLWKSAGGSFCPWFTYKQSCGKNHTGSYAQYMPDAALAATQSSPNAWFADAFAYAQTWLGVPYLWAGCSRSGIDCSCYVETVLGHEHIGAPRTTVQQIQWTHPVSRDAALPGDLVYFDNTCQDCGANPTHVGIYIGSGKMIDAGGTHVQINDIFTGFYASKNPRFGRVP